MDFHGSSFDCHLLFFDSLLFSWMFCDLPALTFISFHDALFFVFVLDLIVVHVLARVSIYFHDFQGFALIL